MKYEWFKLKNLGQTAELYIYGEITTDKWFDEEVTPTEIAAELDSIKHVDTLNVYVNSPGGNVFAGIAIYNQLKRFGENRTINMYVDGIAASISSLVVLAGDNVVIPHNARYMIHNPFFMGVAGDAMQLREYADRLDDIKNLLLDAYIERTGMERDELSQMMDAETWFSGDKALEVGFATSVGDEIKMAACIRGDNIIFNGIAVPVNRFKAVPNDIPEDKGPSVETLLALQQQSHRHRVNVLKALTNGDAL